MVLRSSALLLVVVALGCLHRDTPPKPERTVPLAVYIVNGTGQTASRIDTPKALRERLMARLAPVGLQVDVRDSSAETATNTKVLAASIAKHAAAQTGHPERILLLETQSQFYNELEGRFRWTVLVQATFFYVSRPGDALSTSFDAPAILNFPHQGASDALRFAADPIAREVAAVARRFIVEQPDAAAPADAEQPREPVTPEATGAPEPAPAPEPEPEPEATPAGNPLSNPQAPSRP
jgi:hypothetical protein